MKTMNTLNYADIFRAELNRRNYHFQEKEISSGIRFSLDMAAENIRSLSFSYVVRPNGQITILSYPASDISAGKRTAFLKLANELNGEQRYTKYFLDEDQDFCAEFEFILYEAGEEQIGKHMFRMLALATNILDDAMPRILTELWKREEEVESFNDEATDTLFRNLLSSLSDEGNTDSD